MVNRERLLNIEGTVNCRDIGGYATQDGKQTRWRVYFRSDGLDTLTPSGQQALLDQGITTVIDLRRAEEARKWPDQLPDGITYHQLAFFEETPSLREVFKIPDLVVQYSQLIDECQPAVKTVLETIAQAENGGVLYHCAGGKDRTGLITALLLGLAGVDDETIAQDFELTTTYTAPYRAQWRSNAIKQGMDPDYYDKTAYVKARMMLGTLAHLHKTYGGIAGYVQAIGIDDNTISALRNRLIDA